MSSVAPFVEFLAKVCPPLLLCPEEDISRGLATRSATDQVHRFLNEDRSESLFLTRYTQNKTSQKKDEVKVFFKASNENVVNTAQKSIGIEDNEEDCAPLRISGGNEGVRKKDDGEGRMTVLLKGPPLTSDHPLGAPLSPGHKRRETMDEGEEEDPIPFEEAIEAQEEEDILEEKIKNNAVQEEEEEEDKTDGKTDEDEKEDIKASVQAEMQQAAEYEIVIDLDISSLDQRPGSRIAFLKKTGFHQAYFNSSSGTNHPDEFVNHLHVLSVGCADDGSQLDLIRTFLRPNNTTVESTQTTSGEPKGLCQEGEDMDKLRIMGETPSELSVGRRTAEEIAENAMQIQSSKSRGSLCASPSTKLIWEEARKKFSENRPRSSSSFSPVRSVIVRPWVPAGPVSRTASSSPRRGGSGIGSPCMHYNEEDITRRTCGARSQLEYTNHSKGDNIDERTGDGAFEDISTVPRSSSSRMQSPQNSSSRFNQRSGSNSPSSYTLAHPILLRRKARSEYNSPIRGARNSGLAQGTEAKSTCSSPSGRYSYIRDKPALHRAERSEPSHSRPHRRNVRDCCRQAAAASSSPSRSPPASLLGQTPTRPSSRTEEELRIHCDFLHTSRLRTDAKIRSLRLEKSKQEHDGCTFHPQTNTEIFNRHSSSSSMHRCMLLYERGLHSKAQKRRLETQVKKEHIQEEKKRYSFRPSINQAIPWMEANNPRGFHETVARLRKKETPRECISKAPPQNVEPFCLSENMSNMKKPAVKAHLSLNLPHGKHTSITIREGDNPARVALNSKRLFGLTDYQKDVLQKQIHKILQIV